MLTQIFLKTGGRAAPRVIRAPVIEHLPDEQAAWGDFGVFGTSRWFLACGLGGNNVVWVHTIGQAASEGSPVVHMGRQLQSFPSLRCYVYARNVHLVDPVEPEWVRQDHLMGSSLFVGINYPFFLDAPQPAAGNDVGTVPVFRPNCVFAAHSFCNMHPLRGADWCRMPVNQGVAIGSALFYDPYLSWGQFYEAPMWFVPTLPDN